MAIKLGVAFIKYHGLGAGGVAYLVEGLPSKPQFPSILRVQILVASALGRRKQEVQKFKAIFSHRASWRSVWVT